MRKKRWINKRIASLCLALTLIASTGTVSFGAVAEENTEKNQEDGQNVENAIEIGSVEDFLEFVENCKYDSYSVEKTFILTADLDMSSLDFGGIGYFNGTFDGNGHKITHVSLSPKGSDWGFFRYIGEKGNVSELSVSGILDPSGSGENIGGIVGVNYGTVLNCSFEGSVSGKSAVGAVAGFNKETGQIIGTESSAIVLATNYTGGIAGKNEGLISGSRSGSSINMEELQTTLDLGGVDLGSLNLTRNMVNRNNMGGIAGSSSGIITECNNTGTVGYSHTGYNVGGIAGSQSGKIINSVNEGRIYGRKDVGGIVGQAEPYIESEYLEDKVAQTREDISRLNRTLSGISSTISATSAEARGYADSLAGQYTESLGNVSDSLNALSDSVAQEHPEAQQYVSNINSAMDSIHSIEASDGRLTQEQIDVIEGNLGTINDNLGNLNGTFSGSGESAEELVSNISDQLKNENRQQDIKKMADTVDRGIQSVANSISSAVNQMNHIVNQVGDDLSVLTGEEEYIEDISSIETAENTDGVVSGCVNRGEINGDLNAGGIAGTMNIEYDGDPEFDLDLTGSLNITLRSTVNNVIIHSKNYGPVNAKKNCAGGIAGLQELGFIYDCEGYGIIQSDSGSYLGGIAGRSASTIRGSYSLCNISGKDYVGGICGSGYTVMESISICSIESDGERSGSIAGTLDEEGTVRDNYFVNDNLHGVDNISYAGIADRTDYETVMDMEHIPEGFHQVTVTFLAEDEVLAEKTVAYGSTIPEADFPRVEEKEGCYVSWVNAGKLKEIKRNMTVTAEYVPWTESVAGNRKSEDGKTLFLAAGEFYEDTVLMLGETDGPENLAENVETAYAFTWELESGEEKRFEELEGHFYIPEGDKTPQLWIQKDGVWSEAEAGKDGSYLVADIPYGAPFAVVMLPADQTIYLAAGAAAAGALIVLFAVRIGKKRAKNPVPVGRKL